MIFRALIEDKRVQSFALINLSSDDKGELFIEIQDRDGEFVNIKLSKFLDYSFQDGNVYYSNQFTYLIK